MSKDANHATIVRAFVRTVGENNVVDLSNIGDGCPDLLIGYTGESTLIEVKRPAIRAVRSGLRSTKCGNCMHERKKHDSQGRCVTCKAHRDKFNNPDDPSPLCTKFVPDYGPLKAPGGVVSARQKKWHRTWQGCPIEIVEDEDDVEHVLDDMRRRSAGRAFAS